MCLQWGEPRVWLYNCLSVSCYFWFLLMSSSSPSSHALSFLWPITPASLSCHPCLTLTCTPHRSFQMSDSRRKRHRSCDSEEDQQLSPQAKRLGGGGPSLLVSDLDSEVCATLWLRSSGDHSHTHGFAQTVSDCLILKAQRVRIGSI